MAVRRSEMSWALHSMLRRSWLILLTARPSWASRFFWMRSWVSSRCICASSRSAVPISSSRPEGAMMRLGILGVLAEVQHVARDAHHRPHEQRADREVDERRRHERDHDREPDDVERRSGPWRAAAAPREARSRSRRRSAVQAARRRGWCGRRARRRRRWRRGSGETRQESSWPSVIRWAFARS